MSNDYTTTLYSGPPTAPWEPRQADAHRPLTYPWPLTPEEMKQAALEATVVDDLLKRITALEARVLELEKQPSR